MINLYEDDISQKKFLTKENLLNELSDEKIFRYYIGEFKIGKAFSSPLSKDAKPSFTIFIPDKYPDRLFYKDFRLGSGDSIMFVFNLFGFSSYYDALSKIATDFNLKEKYIISDFTIKRNYKSRSDYDSILDINDNQEAIVSEKVSIQIKSRNWKKYDRRFWSQYCVNYNILNKFIVKPTVNVFINDNVFKSDRLSYAYPEIDQNGVIHYKIYQPHNKKLKWLNNYPSDTISGYMQLPKVGDLLIITKSLKDIMCFNALGYNGVISPQTEGYEFSDTFMEEMFQRFNRVVFFYDFDDAGIEFGSKRASQFGVKSINTGSSEFKDISDYCKKYGKTQSINLIKKLLK